MRIIVGSVLNELKHAKFPEHYIHILSNQYMIPTMVVVVSDIDKNLKQIWSNEKAVE